MRGPSTRRAMPSLTRHARSAALDESSIVSSRSSRIFWRSRRPARISKPPPAVRNDGSARTNVITVAPAPHERFPVDATPGDLLRANASHPVDPRLSRLSLPARDLHDGKALPPIQKFFARMIGGRRTHCDLDCGACVSAGTPRQLQPAGVPGRRSPLYNAAL
jgi:hypothetical protein